MGYVPPHHNITALQYGSRMPEEKPFVKRVTPVQPILFQRVPGGKTKEYDRYERNAELTRKRRDIEKELYGHGRLFDGKA
ncbi:hypothetical protein ACFPU1_06740 [Thalassorhabdus alkalitolerans]|uniref:Uncharacterized protein n=1 Tax=Thalassorhabdus alkalitolerans TaxID=2282697 RepID=A0ABW0YM39_9BACI